ncbi:MAG: winged helix-turn-helix transcriptional regulator, partial [Thiothrix sp.]|nr:winged helix-turn-helix transcriptional regulator [Thiothrix sp.]
VVQYGNLRFDRAAARVQINGNDLDLPRREFCVLDLLLRHQDKTLSKARIIEQLCSFDEDEAPSDNAIELYIARLRKKLGHSNISIRTLRGIGYILHVDTRP